jgi:hypothetical protein
MMYPDSTYQMDIGTFSISGKQRRYSSTRKGFLFMHDGKPKPFDLDFPPAPML